MSQAVKELQTILNKNGAKLIVDGDLGNKTKQAIDVLNIPSWLKVAMKEIGTKEIVGTVDNPQVTKYHVVSGIAPDDEIPWCGSFVNWVMKTTGFNLTVKTPARAKSWLNFGVHSDPVIGAIAVKSRVGGGHVGIVLSVNKNNIYLVGGNQSNEVNIRKYKVSDFVDFRVPLGYQNTYKELVVENATSNGSEA